MKNVLLSFLSIAVMSMALPVHAQTANSQSNSTSAAGAQSGSSSGAAIILNQNAPSSGTFTNNERVSGGTSNNLNSTGHTTSDVTVRNVPTVYVPGVVTGNVCALGASAGGSMVGFGVAFGATWESMSCEDRQRIALLHNMGNKVAAKEYACASDRRYYDAMKFEASPCAVRPAWEPKYATGQPVPAPAPTPVVYTPPPSPPIAKVYPRCNPRAGITDNCIS